MIGQAMTSARAAVRRWARGLLASTAWRPVRRTGVWSYWQNHVDGRRLAIQSRRGESEALDRTFMRPGDLVWGREGGRFFDPVELPWQDWRLR